MVMHLLNQNYTPQNDQIDTVRDLEIAIDPSAVVEDNWTLAMRQPGSQWQALPFQIHGGKVLFTIPELHIYTLVVLSPPESDTHPKKKDTNHYSG